MVELRRVIAIDPSAELFLRDTVLLLLRRPHAPIDLRALGALILLYGISFTRIRELRSEDLDQRPDGLNLALDRRDGHQLRPAASALITLLEDIPPPVLSALLGIHPQTAEHRARHAQPDWSAYLHARSATT